MPMFVMTPESVVVIVGDQVTLMCSAEATPTAPSITWWDGDGAEIIGDQMFDISSGLSESGTVTFSMLYFNATAAENRTGNGSMIQCRATVQLNLINRTLVNDSEVAVITIAGKIDQVYTTYVHTLAHSHVFMYIMHLLMVIVQVCHYYRSNQVCRYCVLYYIHVVHVYT